MRTFRIVYTSDIHGRLFARPGETGLEETGKAFHKDGNTLVLDGGDLLQGGPGGAFLARTGAQNAAAVMNALGSDAVTLGNHDLNYGLSHLENYLTHLNGCCLCANLRDRAGRLPLADSRIFTLENGLRLGVVGLCTEGLAGWERRETLDAITLEPVLQAARRALDAIRDRCDVTVGLYHGGFETDPDTGLGEPPGENAACLLCRTLPFHLLLTGHQHLQEPGRLLSGTYAVQPGAFGRCWAEIFGEVPDDGGTPVFHSRLVPAPPPPSQPTPLGAALDAWEGETLARLPRALPVGDRVEAALHGSPLADFINEVQLAVTGADISATCLAPTAEGLPALVRMGDVYRAYPSANTLCTVSCSGAVLRQALEWTGCFLTPDGEGYRIHPPLPGPQGAAVPLRLLRRHPVRL